MSIRLKYRIPSEVGGSSCRHDLSGASAVEDDRLVARTSDVTEDALGVGGLVRVSGEEIIQTDMASLLEEPEGSDTRPGGSSRERRAVETVPGWRWSCRRARSLAVCLCTI